MIGLRKIDPEGGADVEDALDFDGAAVGLDDGVGDGEAEAGAAFLAAGAGAVDTVESFEEVGDVFLGDAGAGVLDGKGGALFVAGEGEVDLPFLAVVFHGVAEEIKKGLPHALGIEGKWCRVDVGDEGDLAFVGEGADEFDNFVGEVGEVAVFAVEVELAGVDLGEFEEGIDEGAHVLGGVHAGLEGVLVFLGGAFAAECELRFGEDDGDGGSHFVRGIGGETDLVLEGGFEFFEGVVEDGGELAEFAFGFGNLDAAGEVAIGDSVGGVADGFDGLQGAADEEGADEEAECDESAADADEAELEVGEFLLVGLKGGAADDDASAGRLVNDFAEAVTGAGGEAGFALGRAIGECVGNVFRLIDDVLLRPAPGDDVDVALDEFRDPFVDGFDVEPFFGRASGTGSPAGATGAARWKIIREFVEFPRSAGSPAGAAFRRAGTTATTIKAGK